MAAPHLYLDSRDIRRIRENLDRYDWYRASFARFQTDCDRMLREGFTVPDTCGYVFYNSCKSDNTALIFDPYAPDRHVCPTCGMNYRDPPFERAWQCYYHQWLAQMSIQLGLVYAVTGDSAYAAAVRRMLLDYVRKYPGYENSDNELGTTKTFQSTYIESIWLSYLACGFDLTNADSCYSEEDRRAVVRELFLPSAAVIRDYDEKWNNRQAFNNSGMCAAALLAEDGELLHYVLNGEHGFAAHMERSVLADGLWYEGDNYHFATVPSLVNMAEMCRHGGIDLYHRSFGGHSMEDMFLAPLKSLQPDLSFPSRKDSPYASQIAQRWYSGLYELAHARYENAAFGRILQVMYAHPLPEGADLKNAAGLMDIFPAEPASRSGLDWRGFMTMKPDLGEETGVPVTRSVNMEGTGLAVLRREKGKQYLSLDYGDYGGGHGHPDRLAVTWFADGRRWLCDFGTGQYYFDHLNWYRSTLGHNTLEVDGRRQDMRNGVCTVFGETPECSAARGEVQGLIPGVDAARTVLLLEGGLFLDLIEAYSETPHLYRSAYHSFGSLELPGPAQAASLEGDACRFLEDVSRFCAKGDAAAVFRTEEASLLIRSLADGETAFYSAKAYGPPNEIPRRFPVCIEEREGKSAAFWNLLEDIPAGAESSVRSFMRTEEGCAISLTDGTVLAVSAGEGISVCRYRGGQLLSFSGFGCRRIPGVLETALTPDWLYGVTDSAGWQLTAAGRYGALTPGTALTGEISCNGKRFCGKGPLLEGFLLEKPAAAALVKGIPNLVPVEFGNFSDQDIRLLLDRDTAPFPYGLALEHPMKIELTPGEQTQVLLSLIPSDEAAGEPRWHFAEEEPLALHISPALGKSDALAAVRAENRTAVPLEIRLSFGGQAVLPPGGEQVFFAGMEAFRMEGDKAVLELEVFLPGSGKVLRRRWEKAIVCPEWLPRRIPLDSAPFQPNLMLEGEKKVARNERRWGGEADLSARGMLTVTGGSSLTLRLKVRDDRVLFSGGKFPYDNDTVQLCFSRPAANGERQVSRVMFSGSVADEAAVVRPVENLQNPEEISLSVWETEGGYALLADIPFHCLGGAPEKGETWGFDLLVNDRDSGVRRDLQLIWSGAYPGERLYLREDHHDPERFGLIRF